MNPSDDTRQSPSPYMSRHGLDEDADSFRPRPRNRRRTRRRRGVSSTVRYRVRLGFMAIGGVIAAYAAFLLIQKIAHPYLLGHKVGQQVAEMRAKLDREERSNAALRERILFLRSPEGAEVMARRSGWHRKGEIVYLLPVAPNDASADETK